MPSESVAPEGVISQRLVQYFHDCLAAQSDWARAVNVIEQKDVTLLPLSAAEQTRFGEDGTLGLTDNEALEFARRAATAGSDNSLFLGALFLVGHIPATEEQAEKRFCAPLLEVPVSVTQDTATRQVVVEPDEIEFTINYSLVGELLEEDAEDDLQDRLADLAALVPDFPIDASEFATFWNGFRMIFPEVSIADEVPNRTRRQPPRLKVFDQSTPDSDGPEMPTSAAAADVSLELVDFFVPEIPKDGAFCLLPSTAMVLGRRSGLAMSALNELRSMIDMPLQDTAFEAVFAGESNRERAIDESGDDGCPLSLTPVQRSIVRSARSNPLTVVTGPPGTGKSHTITAIVLDALQRGESVLIASQMDKAVEVVATRVQEIAGPYSIARSGGRAAQRILAKTISRLTGPLNGLETVSRDQIRDTRRRYDVARQQLQRLRDRFTAIVAAERTWSTSQRSRERLESLCTLPVFDVDSRPVRKAVRLMESAEPGLAQDAGWARRLWSRWQLRRVRRLLRVPQDWECVPDELRELVEVQSLRADIADAERTLKTAFAANLVWDELAETEQQADATALALLRLTRHQRLRGLVSDQAKRAELRHLATLLRRRRRDLKKELQDKLAPDTLLQTFPAWACTSRSLCEVLPATPGLFDVVVVDEASQCDPALAAVALLRGRRAVVVGDPHQLRHVCFLSRAREQAAFAAAGIDSAMQQRYHYRRSLFDVASDAVDQDCYFLLDEHFRSHPRIIEFSNGRFYENALHIMTARPGPASESVIQIHDVRGHRRKDSSVNDQEVDAVLEIVRGAIEESDTAKPISIGVVSPFRDHADAIRDRLLRDLAPDSMELHSIVVGTAHSLQGDEKDLVILATSIDAESHPASLRFLESPNLFNVAITRARNRVVVVTSVSHDQLPPGLLRDYLHYATSEVTGSDESGRVSELSGEVQLRLQEQDVQTCTGFVAAGTQIDLVALADDGEVAVLIDSTENTAAADALRIHERLVRAGWTVVRLSDRSWRADWFACCEAVCEALNKAARPSGG